MVGQRYLRQQLAHVAALKPDLLLATGDLITGGYRYAEPVAELLAEVAPRFGVICTLGNHDYGVRGKGRAGEQRAARIRRALERNGLVLLRNEAVTIAGVTWVGLDDLWSRRLDADAAFEGVAGPAVCLNHDPKNARQLLRYPWHWMLAGHTHGRQLATSVIGRRLNQKRRRPYVAGLYKLSDHQHLYVNRGLSYGQRRHRWCRPEVTLLRLTQTAHGINAAKSASTS
jgi:predicted MPP superfamily phosphohydrolase